MSALLLVGAALLLVRRPSASPARRRPVALLVDSFGLALIMLAILFIAGLRGWPQIETVRHVTFAALGLAPVVFLFGLLDARLARTDVGALLMDLRAHPAGDLREPLARALHDPSLTPCLLAAEVRHLGRLGRTCRHPARRDRRAGDPGDLSRPRTRRRPRVRPVARRRARVTGRRRGGGRHRSGEQPAAGGAAGPAARAARFPRAGHRRRADRSGSGSNATCTTVRSNAWSHWRSRSD